MKKEGYNRSLLPPGIILYGLFVPSGAAFVISECRISAKKYAGGVDFGDARKQLIFDLWRSAEAQEKNVFLVMDIRNQYSRTNESRQERCSREMQKGRATKKKRRRRRQSVCRRTEGLLERRCYKGPGLCDPSPSFLSFFCCTYEKQLLVMNHSF